MRHTKLYSELEAKIVAVLWRARPEITYSASEMVERISRFNDVYFPDSTDIPCVDGRDKLRRMVKRILDDLENHWLAERTICASEYYRDGYPYPIRHTGPVYRWTGPEDDDD